MKCKEQYFRKLIYSVILYLILILIPIYLLYQLKEEGILVIPLRIGEQEGHTFCIITKDKDKNIHIEPKEAVRYVPLIK